MSDIIFFSWFASQLTALIFLGIMSYEENKLTKAYESKLFKCYSQIDGLTYSLNRLDEVIWAEHDDKCVEFYSDNELYYKTGPTVKAYYRSGRVEEINMRWN